MAPLSGHALGGLFTSGGVSRGASDWSWPYAMRRSADIICRHKQQQQEEEKMEEGGGGGGQEGDGGRERIIKYVHVHIQLVYMIKREVHAQTGRALNAQDNTYNIHIF